MQQIISKGDISIYKDLSNAVKNSKINQFILDAQMSDLSPLIGDLFFFDVMNNLTNPEYQELLNGCKFTFNGVEIEHLGLKRVLVEFAWGRYTYFGGFNDSPFGNVIKTTPHSTPTGNNDRRDIWKQSRQMANDYFKTVKYYLSVSDFSKCEFTNSQSSSNFNISKII